MEITADTVARAAAMFNLMPTFYSPSIRDARGYSPILLSSIRTWLRARGFEDDASQIQRDFIATRELGGKENAPLIILNENNNQYFEEFVVSEKPEEDIVEALAGLNRYDPSRLLLEAILICRNKISEIGEAGNNEAGASRLYELVDFIQDKLKIVRLNVSSEADAYTVFETLNDRGLDLSVLDLVKNHMFGTARTGAQKRDVKSRRTQMIATLSSVQADDFLKVWWTSRHGRVQTAQLFPRFKDEVNSGPAAARVSSDMLAASELYAALEIADDPIWTGYSAGTREIVRALRLLSAKQTRPIVLSALEKFGEREMERLMRLLEVLIVRYQLIGGGRTGRLEIASAGVASGIFEGNITTATQVRNEMRDILPDNEEFEAAFINKQERNNQKVRYILSKLELQARRSGGAAPLGDELGALPTLTVEHVFPKSPNDDWSRLLEDDPSLAEDCTFKLGNLCLLTNVNRSLGNRSFEEKKVSIVESQLHLSRMIGEQANWTRAEIEARQRQLASYASAVWRFD